MIEKKHSFADRPTGSIAFAAGPLDEPESAGGIPNRRNGLATRRTHLYRYLRPLGQMAGRWLVIAAVLVPLATACRPAQAAVDAATVQRSIDRGVAYLRKTQNQRGGWQEFGGQSCGLSALCTLAMLNCGVEKDDPAMVSAMAYLRSFQPKETYSIALQTLAFCQLGSARDLGQIRNNIDLLVQNQKTSGERIGSWDYGNNRGSGDPSNAQFAILALGAARDRGIEIDPQVFERALGYWTSRQRGGGWSYNRGQLPAGSMTCAGIASMIISRGGLEGSASVKAGLIRCCGGDSAAQDPVEAGLEWLARNFSLQVNPGGSTMTYFYYLYAFERVGRLSGRRFIGGHDWYREGAEVLVDLQDGFQGFWAGDGPVGEGNRDIATSFALLFLSKGKRQVVVGRLKYPSQPAAGVGAVRARRINAPAAQGSQWKKHPDALRQLVRHVERDWGRDLTWQTIEADRAEVVDLLQAPVLVISGRQSLRFSDDLSARLKEYVDQGGCVLFEAEGGDGCGDASGFTASVRQLCEDWYPGAPLERLPPSHPVWSAQRNVDPAVLGKDFWVYGVQACCRTAVFYVPQSLSCRWQLSDILFHRQDGSAKARKQIDAAVRLGENVIAYATGRELKDKLDQRMVIRSSDIPEPTRSSVRLAMLALDAGGNEARRALPNAAAIISQRVPIPITTATDPIGFASDQLRDIQLLWIHGRTDFTLTAAQRESLSEFIGNGGMVIGTAICGNKAFADAFRREIAQILPDAPLQSMPPDHPALTNAFGGFDVATVTIRSPAGGAAGQGISRRTSPPVLETAEVDSMTSVFFSPLDISCALESQNSVQCPGYSTDEAAKIVANLILFAMQQ
jgi:hypothetical protein